MTKMTRTITIPKDTIKYINKLLSMTGDEIYDKYGLKRDETMTFTADFENGYEADVKLVICDDDSYPYTEAVLFHNGSEVSCSDGEDEITGEWEFYIDDDDTTYIVIVEEATA